MIFYSLTMKWHCTEKFNSEFNNKTLPQALVSALVLVMFKNKYRTTYMERAIYLSGSTEKFNSLVLSVKCKLETQFVGSTEHKNWKLALFTGKNTETLPSSTSKAH